MEGVNFGNKSAGSDVLVRFLRVEG